MTDTVLVILGSARKNSDTKFYVDLVFKDLPYKIIDLLDADLSHYSYDNEYTDRDIFLNLVEEILKHKLIVFATPVYWYAMSGVMKIFFDRLTDLVTTEKIIGRQLKDKSVYLLAVGSDKEMPLSFDVPFKLTSQYFGLTFKGHIYFSTKHVDATQNQEETIKTFIAEIGNNAEIASRDGLSASKDI